MKKFVYSLIGFEPRRFSSGWSKATGALSQGSDLVVRAVALASALVFGLEGTSVVHAATATFSTTAPTLGVSDISQLTNAADRTNNVGGSVDDQGGNFVYIDNGRPAQGQTFTTGGNANGYALTAVTLKQVAYDTYALVPDMTYYIRITSPSGSTLRILPQIWRRFSMQASRAFSTRCAGATP